MTFSAHLTFAISSSSKFSIPRVSMRPYHAILILLQYLWLLLFSFQAATALSTFWILIFLWVQFWGHSSFHSMHISYAISRFSSYLTISWLLTVAKLNLYLHFSPYLLTHMFKHLNDISTLIIDCHLSLSISFPHPNSFLLLNSLFVSIASRHILPKLQTLLASSTLSTLPLTFIHY